MKKIVLILLLVMVSGCVQPSLRLPATNQYSEKEYKKLRLDMRREALKYNRSQLKRVNDIHYKLIKNAGEELCAKKLQADLGIVYMQVGRFSEVSIFNPSSFLHREQIDDNAAIFKKSENSVLVFMVVKDSPAYKAGIKENDRILSILGVAATADERSFNKLSTLLNDHGKTGLPVDVEVMRGKKILNFTLQPDIVCPYPVEIDRKITVVNAFADGKSIMLTQELLDYIEDDDILATIIAHELAHNNLGHVQASSINSNIGGFFGMMTDFIFGTFSGTSQGERYGNMVYSKPFEFEADYTAMYYMARAGYDYKKANKVHKYLVNRNVMSIYTSSDSHPKPQDRYILMAETAKEIDLKKALEMELLPNFQQSNNFLRKKKGDGWL